MSVDRLVAPLFVGFALIVSAPAAAREALGIFGTWGAFRDARPPRCFAIAEPAGAPRGEWRPFLSVARWPARGVAGQIHVRLSRARAAGAPVYVTIGSFKARLVAGGVDGWAADARADAAIVAAMRGGDRLVVTSNGVDGRRFTDVYPLRGAATAIDAATLACAKRG
ncbi:hypothetical protein CLG96_05000 [Sphingomonas oleivorans]|uniref:Uncharacterized protein n=1 Tax=Sphingomonas oleivorans TaxID=1735121 RepID=A0A2T5G2U3_9SPHN|nr:hypothetical protein [Sphingomonas oleivorans]PTQ13450.1 hypothetical protein CLG96_05000 [Sphingomonas oleivorans]